jgi:hypothetical protein
MSTGTSEPPTARQAAQDNQFKIDFIDPLFAVAVHIGFVEGLMQETWLESRSFPTRLDDLANVSLFIAAFWTIVASWVGYHKSIQNKPILGGARFVLDIMLLGLYIFLLLYFKNPIGLSAIMIVIYCLYIAWDFYKTKEYTATYYHHTQPPNGLGYLGLCLADWLRPGRHDELRSEVITVGWTVFFAALFPFTLLSVMMTIEGKIVFALVLIIANTIYRYDKISHGAWICSTPFKLFIASMICFLILYHTKALCFS